MEETSAVSRRTLLLVAAAGSGVAFAAISGDAAARAATTDSGGAADLAAIERNGLITIDGVRTEYADAVANFPLELPAGYAFPEVSQTHEAVGGQLREAGTGQAEASCQTGGVTLVAKITVSLASLALLAGITACAPTPEPVPAAEAVPTASATMSPEPADEAAEAEPVATADTAPVWCNTDTAPRLGTTPYDQGPMKGAMGEVEVVDGVPTSYTVAVNDSLPAIGQRFCIDYGTIGQMTTPGGMHGEIHPGDVLRLRT